MPYPHWTLAKSRIISDRQNFLRGEGCSYIYWVEARNTAKYPVIHRTPAPERIILPKMSMVLRLRNPDRKACHSNVWWSILCLSWSASIPRHIDLSNVVSPLSMGPSLGLLTTWCLPSKLGVS